MKLCTDCGDDVEEIPENQYIYGEIPTPRKAWFCTSCIAQRQAEAAAWNLESRDRQIAKRRQVFHPLKEDSLEDFLSLPDRTPNIIVLFVAFVVFVALAIPIILSFTQ